MEPKQGLGLGARGKLCPDVWDGPTPPHPTRREPDMKGLAVC